MPFLPPSVKRKIHDGEDPCARQDPVDIGYMPVLVLCYSIQKDMSEAFP
jgi:hypothetical protein